MDLRVARALVRPQSNPVADGRKILTAARVMTKSAGHAGPDFAERREHVVNVRMLTGDSARREAFGGVRRKLLRQMSVPPISGRSMGTLNYRRPRANHDGKGTE